MLRQTIKLLRNPENEFNLFSSNPSNAHHRSVSDWNPDWHGLERDGAMSYHRFVSEGEEYGSFQVFFGAIGTWTDETGEQHETGSGWYWWACFPGCLPDSDPIGPFETEQAAIDDAQENF